MRKKLIAFLVVFALIASAAPALANEPTDAYIIPDVLLVRPIGLAAIVLGSVIFVVSLPVALPTGSVGKVGQRLVADPVEFTFVRPIGDFDYKLGTWMRTNGRSAMTLRRHSPCFRCLSDVEKFVIGFLYSRSCNSFFPLYFFMLHYNQ